MDEIRKVPPITLFLLGSTLTISLGPLLSLLNPYHILLWYPAILKRYQLWRLVTPFFFTAGGGLQMLFDLFLLGRNSLDLETSASPPAGFSRRTSLYAWALLCMGVLILATNYPLGSTVLFGPMLSALNYLWARANPHAKVSFFGMVTLPAAWLPYAYLGFDVLRGGLPLAVQSATGLLAAHAWLTLANAAQGGAQGSVARRLATPPGWLRALLPDSVAPEDAAAQAARDAPGGRGGRVATRTWGGTAFAPPGREWGDGQGQWAASRGNAAAGQTIGGQGSAAGSWGSSFSRLFGGAGGGGSNGAGGASTSSTSAAGRRDALLEATERRLRAQREASIAGRNARSTPTTTTATPADPVSQGQAGRSAGAGASGIPATAASSATLRSRMTGGTGRIRNNNGEKDGREEEEEELDASSSGGAVAEQRRPEAKMGQQATTTSNSSRESGAPGGGGGGHQWGTGQRLGE